jgi:hypothetical protein
MAKWAKCDKCRIKWHIKIKDQTPLRELSCPRCGGPVTHIYSPCHYPLATGEPDLKSSSEQDEPANEIFELAEKYRGLFKEGDGKE